MDNLLVSLIMPVYNTGEYLRATLDSLVNQSYNNLEILVVDDCSQDESCNIVESYILSHPNIKLIRLDKNGGQSRARNIALLQAKGDYIYFMDSDDILPPDAIYALVKAISDENCDFIIGDVLTFGIPNEHLYSSHCNYTETYSNNKEIVRRYTLLGWCVAPWAKLFKKEFLLENNIFFKEGIILEDELFTFTYVYYAQRVKVIPDVVYHYYIRGNSTMTQKFSDRHLKGLKGDIEGMKEVLSENYQTPLTQCIIVLAYRLAEAVLKGDFNDDIKCLYVNFLIGNISPRIVVHSIPYGIKTTIKALMFLLPTNWWNVYIKLLGRV